VRLPARGARRLAPAPEWSAPLAKSASALLQVREDYRLAAETDAKRKEEYRAALLELARAAPRFQRSSSCAC
jgi:hypothetical protein